MSETPQEPEQPDAEQPATEPSGNKPSAAERAEQADAKQAEKAEKSDAAGAPAKPESPKSLTFRITPVALLAVLAITICATPLATTAGTWALLLYLIPLGLLVWILRTRTTVDTQQVVVRTAFGRTKFSWDDVVSLRLDQRRWLKAVLHSGKEIQLPAVRVRDLPRVAAISGGRLPDPTTQE
ncbi:PH domain-containing protein [Saccharopolyspora spinosa]|uniref:PH (Pleckstrin Homology) domain-containing protein n=1 Tax=Saccharopolyspora spinosa TaxID=60894 RepID=A0A2N3YA04_SACSN|nr:PH domain-containing protein [Saccharopolyspora spinosa]PKW19681.1 PH (Pleckstrin Homology) domain-containing protein [Saccharopolyspora spinosa]